METAPQPNHQPSARQAVWIVLLVLAVVNGISCAAGAWGIAAGGAQLFGGDILAGTLFDDKYWLAALALAFVGIAQVLALVAHLRRSRWASILHAAAGMTMMVFIFVEVLIINETLFLQPLFFALGAVQLSLSPLYLRLWHSRTMTP